VAEVDRLAQARGESRAAFVRRACEQFIRALREQAMEAAYEQGYRDHPEALGFAEAAARVSAESWPDDGLPARCVANPDALTTVPLALLKSQVCSLSPAKLRAVEAALKLALDLR